MPKLIVALLYVFNLIEVNCERDVDINGYITYCPCMGRFGNQADQFLGVLGFAKALNRTLIVPAWVEYRTGEAKSIQVPFDTYFNITELAKCHKVILMEEFMRDLAPTIWPPSHRISLCYDSRGTSKSCNAKEGNPFGPFWDTYGIDFVDSSFYKPLGIDVYHTDVKQFWLEKYPALAWPVLAFTGAPASFPVQSENKHLQKCIVWNDVMTKKAKMFVKEYLPPGAFIGIHLRNGVDWERACEFISSTPNLFAAAQCLGYRNERGNATSMMCLPSFEVVIRQVKRVIRNGKNVKSVFVASDNNHMVKDLTNALSRMDISVHKLKNTATPHLDLAILGRANYFIGNCISSFTAFAAREREVKGLPNLFWAFPKEKSYVHEEL